jgi:UDPglucose 6-dehydrogenase
LRIAVLDTGYVGLVSAACFAQAGQHVTCVDIDEGKIALLRRGKMPIYEQGLHDFIAEGRRHRRLHSVSDASAAVSNADIVFIAVGTPTRASVQRQNDHRAARPIDPSLRHCRDRLR